MTLALIVVWGMAIITIFLLISSLFKLNDDVRSAMQATQLLTETLLWVVVTLGLSYAVTSIITEITGRDGGTEQRRGASQSVPAQTETQAA